MPRRISPTARRRRPLAVLTAVLVVLVGAWGWFAATKIYFPRLDQAPENADVLVQVGGIPWKDYQTARDTARRLGIPDLVLSDPSSGTEVHDRYCGPLEGVRVHCFAPDPSTTRGGPAVSQSSLRKMTGIPPTFSPPDVSTSSGPGCTSPDAGEGNWP